MQTPIAFNPWQNVIQRCQQAFKQHQIDQCILLNLEALSIVKPLFEKHFKSNPEVAMAATMVTYINLASAFCAAENFHSANKALNEASRLIQNICQSQYLQEEQQVAILRAAHQLRMEWANCQNQQKSHGLDEYLGEDVPSIILNIQQASHSRQIH